MRAKRILILDSGDLLSLARPKPQPEPESQPTPAAPVELVQPIGRPFLAPSYDASLVQAIVDSSLVHTSVKVRIDQIQAQLDVLAVLDYKDDTTVLLERTLQRRLADFERMLVNEVIRQQLESSFQARKRL